MTRKDAVTPYLAALAKLAAEAGASGARWWTARAPHFLADKVGATDAAYIAAASPDVVLALVRVALAAKEVVRSADYERDMFGVRLPDGLLLDIEKARTALADLDR